MVKDSLHEEFENLFSSLSDEKIENIKSKITNNEITSKSTIFELKSKLNLPAQDLNRIKNILINFPYDQGLLLYLDCFSELKRTKEQLGSKTSLVMTGPIIFKKNAENTDAVILNMINSAKRTITLVGYVVLIDTSTIFDALVNATKRGVRIRLVFNKAETHLKKFLRMWDLHVTFPALFTYKPEKKSTNLHAKVLIIDSREILTTSANMTGYGINENLEMGIRHIGIVASNAEKIIDTLIEKKYLVKIDYDL